MAETESEMQQFANDLETTTDELLDIYNKLTEWEIRFHWGYTIKDLDLYFNTIDGDTINFIMTP